jgi:hypothetical protein
MILRALGDDNAKLENREQVTIDSIRNHTARHFPVSTWPVPRRQIPSIRSGRVSGR